MKLQFNKWDLRLLESLSEEELARTQMFLYTAYIKCSSNINFRENHDDIVCDIFELSEVPAKTIANKLKLFPMPKNNPYNKSGITYYTPHVRKRIIDYELPNDWNLPKFSFNTVLLDYLSRLS